MQNDNNKHADDKLKETIRRDCVKTVELVCQKYLLRALFRHSITNSLRIRLPREDITYNLGFDRDTE